MKQNIYFKLYDLTMRYLFCFALENKNQTKIGTVYYMLFQKRRVFFLNFLLFLQKLLQNETQRFKHFLKYIRGYNNALIFTFCKY